MKTILFIMISFLFSACSNTNTAVDDNITNPSIDNNNTTNPPIDDNITNLLYSQQWSINKDISFYEQNDINENASINAQNVMSNYSGWGVKVAVIDDGFDILHPEIKDKIIKAVSVDENGFINSDVSHTSNSEYHGTAVAGIIASQSNNEGIVGVASNVELILVKMPEFLDDFTTIELFKQAIDAGAEVINCSWGTNDVSEAVKEYIDEISINARDGRGVIVVFAAGNSNSDMGNDESALESVIGVGATDKTALRTGYSSYGKNLDIMAPGGYELGITTIDPLGDDGVSEDGYNRYDETNSYGSEVSFIGTSASAPIMTGVIALALEKDSSLTRVEIQELLKKSTQTVGNNTPYIDDMILSASRNPTISGIYGSVGYSELFIRLTSYTTNKIYGFYDVTSGDNNEWSSVVMDDLPDGTYSIEVVSLADNSSIVWATDNSFIVDTTKSSELDKTKRRNNFYGYGKIDLNKLMENI